MQHDWKHVERPGGSHTALDGKKIAFVGFSLLHSGLIRLFILLSPAQLRPSFLSVLVCLSADWTSSLVLLTSPG